MPCFKHLYLKNDSLLFILYDQCLGSLYRIIVEAYSLLSTARETWAISRAPEWGLTS